MEVFAGGRPFRLAPFVCDEEDSGCGCGRRIVCTTHRTKPPSLKRRATEVAIYFVLVIYFVIPSEARDLLFFPASTKQQIPRANAAHRNDMVRAFPRTAQQTRFACL